MSLLGCFVGCYCTGFGSQLGVAVLPETAGGVLGGCQKAVGGLLDGCWKAAGIVLVYSPNRVRGSNVLRETQSRVEPLIPCVT